MRIAVIGSGGREHAIIWKLRENENIKEIEQEIDSKKEIEKDF